jgi:hypothetical protein
MEERNSLRTTPQAIFPSETRSEICCILMRSGSAKTTTSEINPGTNIEYINYRGSGARKGTRFACPALQHAEQGWTFGFHVSFEHPLSIPHSSKTRSGMGIELKSSKFDTTATRGPRIMEDDAIRNARFYHFNSLARLWLLFKTVAVCIFSTDISLFAQRCFWRYMSSEMERLKINKLVRSPRIDDQTSDIRTTERMKLESYRVKQKIRIFSANHTVLREELWTRCSLHAHQKMHNRPIFANPSTHSPHCSSKD